jgi:hypothetical protein
LQQQARVLWNGCGLYAQEAVCAYTSACFFFFFFLCVCVCVCVCMRRRRGRRVPAACRSQLRGRGIRCLLQHSLERCQCVCVRARACVRACVERCQGLASPRASRSGGAAAYSLPAVKHWAIPRATVWSRRLTELTQARCIPWTTTPQRPSRLHPLRYRRAGNSEPTPGSIHSACYTQLATPRPLQLVATATATPS